MLRRIRIKVWIAQLTVMWLQPDSFCTGVVHPKTNIKNRRQFEMVNPTRAIPPSLPTHKSVNIAIFAAMIVFGACDSLVTALTPLVPTSRKWADKSVFFSVLLTIDVHRHSTSSYHE
jgi:hypothetical protein